jgi:hypothetical protein
MDERCWWCRNPGQEAPMMLARIIYTDTNCSHSIKDTKELEQELLAEIAANNVSPATLAEYDTAFGFTIKPYINKKEEK